MTHVLYDPKTRSWPAIEARVLGALLVVAELLATQPELETDDFHDFTHQAVFVAIRNLEAENRPIDAPAVMASIEQTDRVREHLVRLRVDSGFLGALVARAEQDLGDELRGELCADALRFGARFADDCRMLRVARYERTLRAQPPEPAPHVELTGFASMPARIVGEREEREFHAARALNYHQTFLDDCLRAILPHDLVLFGAETGLGKTDLALAIAMANAQKDGVRVGYLALEAEPRELERRTKFSWLSGEAYRRNLADRDHLNYTDWLLGRCEQIIGHLNAECDQWFLSRLCGLRTFYRGQHFTSRDLCKLILEEHTSVDLLVVDHLHYVDADEDENEYRAQGDTMKAIRDVTLRVGKPAIVVAHLRKPDARFTKLVPSNDDFHGSSNITKIATQIITIARATNIEASKWWLSPTFMAVLKDRRAGAPPFVALTNFDRRTRTYAEDYTLGRLIKNRTAWEQLKVGDRPGWATGHRQLELDV